MIFGLLRKINTAQPVRQGGLCDVYLKTKDYCYTKNKITN